MRGFFLPVSLLSRCLATVLLTSCLAGTGAVADEVSRPRIGLVLGGGGARGVAHVGVLEVLQEMQVPVDCVAGTSMGALVAGAYAGGMTPGTMRSQLAAADWGDMFVDNPDYSEMSHRRKTLARSFPAGSESGVSENGVTYQAGLVAGQKIKLFFNQLMRANQGERNIEELPLPLAIVATDIGNGERVVFRKGPLTQAMRASMSVPGLLAPLDYDGRKLVDGGLVDNLPVGEARELCHADVLIVVNVGTPLLKSEEVGSLLSVSSQMMRILTEQNVNRSLATLKPDDIYIRPDLGDIGAGDFARNADAADRGRAAALRLAPQLRRLAMDREAYAAWWKTIELEKRAAPKIDEIEVVGLRRVNPAVVDRYLRDDTGHDLHPAEINRDLLRIYGDGWYESVDYTVLHQRDRNILRVMPVEKSWGPDYLRFALNLQADSSQGSGFGLRAAYQKTWLNRLGGELLVDTEVGSKSRLGANWYQPLDPAQRFFVEAGTGVEQSRLNIFENDRRIAQYRLTESNTGIALGANVGLLGPVRLGWVQRYRSFDPDIGSPALPRADLSFGGWRVAVDFDQFDRLHFPTRGWAAQLALFDSPELGYSRFDADLRAAFNVGGTVFNGRLRHTSSPRGTLPVFDAGSLGGFLNLTAFAPNQILGDDITYVGLRAEKILGRAPLGLRGDLRVGLALEAAEARKRFTETGRSGILDSTALYFGGDTPLGPAYLGFGYSTSRVSNLFLFIGSP